MSDLWYVYMLRCSDNSIYIGITTSIEARVAAHNAGKGAKYTRGRGPVCVERVMPADGKSKALKLEASIKKLTRAQKEVLILMGPNTYDLYVKDKKK